MQHTESVRTTRAVLAVMLLCLPAAARAVTAAQTYASYCAVCHGERGDGRSHASLGLQPPPRDFTARLLTPEYMTTVIAHGKPGTAMAGWSSQLDSAQIEALAGYIRTAFMSVAEDEKTAAPPASGNIQTASGRRIYESTCSVCHGDDGAGAVWGRTSLNPPPANFTVADPEHGLPRARMIDSVSHGRAGTAMTAYGGRLTESEIAAVVDFIRDTFMSRQAAGTGISPARPATTATTVGMAVLHGIPPAAHAARDSTVDAAADAPLPHGLSGDAAHGRGLYQANCTACHGSTGQGDGPRAYFIFPRPRNFVLAESRTHLNRPRLFDAVSHGIPGREMPAWSKVMGEQQIADIVEYVFQAFISAGTTGPDTQTEAD